MAPKFNSRAIKIAMVVHGCGEVEMACPHLSHESGEEEERGREWGREEEGEREWGREREREGGRHGRDTDEEQERRYKLVQSRGCSGDVFIIPASHPVTVVASRGNLQVLCFGINAENNQIIFLAGN